MKQRCSDRSIHVFEQIEARTLLSAGQADPSFGTNGAVLAGNYPDFNLTAVVVQSDGKVIAAGNSDAANAHVRVMRFNFDGTPDVDFGSAGAMTLDFGGKNAFVNRMLVQSNGRIVMVGSTRDKNSSDNLAVARLMPDGTLDAGFSGDGKLTFDGGTNDELLRLVSLSPGGKIVVGGSISSSNGQDYFVARLKDNGTFDTTFRNTGMRTVDIAALNDDLTAMSVATDGTITLSGTSIGYASKSSYARLNVDGSLDTTFSGDGKNTDSFFQARGVFVRGNGTILVAGDDEETVQLRVFNNDGAATTSFGANGEAKVKLPSPATLDDVVQQADGKFILSGYFTRNGALAPYVLRVDGNGVTDPTFSAPGLVDPTKSSDNVFTRLALAADERVIVGLRTDHATNPATGESMIRRLANDATPILVDGVLTITGTSTADTISLAQSSKNGKLQVTLNDKTNAFSLTGVQTIQVNALSGNDTITSVALVGFKPLIAIDGGDGDDAIVGSSGAEVLNGGTGDDTIHGAGGPDSIDGGKGNDELFGEKGDDSIFGNNGDDELFGGTDNDTLRGGAGADTFSGAAGIDLATYEGETANLSLSLDDVANDGAAGESDNIATDVENIYGGAGGDRIIGDALPNFLYGSGGNDTIHGGDGNDTLKGGQARDRLFGDDGDDLLMSKDGARDTIDGGVGVDTLKPDLDNLDLATNVESTH